MFKSALILMSACLLAVGALAQAPTGQTSLYLRSATTHHVDAFDQYGLPTTLLAAATYAAEVQLGPTPGTGSFESAQAHGAVSGTWISLYARAQADATSDSVPYGALSRATANASVNMPFRVPAPVPSLSGTAGTMVATLLVSGALNLAPGFYDPVSQALVANQAHVYFWASGLGAPTCGFLGSNGCLDITSDYRGTVTTGSGANGVWTMNLPFRYDEWSNYILQLWLQGKASSTATLLSGFVNSHAEADYAHTLAWGGITAVLDAAGQPVSGWTVESLPGVDLRFAAVVPEPGSWPLMAGGLLIVVWRVRRRLVNRS